jgi:PIN like domain
MRSMFPGQFRLSNEGFSNLWSKCIFAVDANVLLNLYRYSPETRQELEKALEVVKDRLFIPHQAAKEFLKNRLIVTAAQAEEYTKAIKIITDLSSNLSNKKKHPFLTEGELPHFTEEVSKLLTQLESQKDALLGRLTNDEILEFVATLFAGKTGEQFDDAMLRNIATEGDVRYQNEIPPGYKDGKKDSSGDPYRKYGDLIIWKQMICKAKEVSKPIIFISDDQKDDWWLEQLGRTIGPRTELREEFIRESTNDFWMYTADKFIEESARITDTEVSQKAIAEIKEVSEEVKAERTASYISQDPPFKSISKEELLDRLSYSEKWATKNDGFLGLAHFVMNYLGHAGYDYATSYDIINQLHGEGDVEIYDHQGEGHERSTKAVRLTKRNQYSSRPLEGLQSLIDSSKYKE